MLQTWRWWNERRHDHPRLPPPGPRVSRADYGANITAMSELARALTTRAADFAAANR